MKPIRFTRHALEQCAERGASEVEVREAILLKKWLPFLWGQIQKLW